MGVFIKVPVTSLVFCENDFGYRIPKRLQRDAVREHKEGTRMIFVNREGVVTFGSYPAYAYYLLGLKWITVELSDV